MKQLPNSVVLLSSAGLFHLMLQFTYTFASVKIASLIAHAERPYTYYAG